MLNGTSSQEELTENIGAGPNLQPGCVVPPGVYVVVHRNPAHTLPHEISITAHTTLPECNKCRGVRFSFKYALPEKIAECEFFGLESTVLIPRMRNEAEALRQWATRSRSFLEESELFLAKVSKTANSEGCISSR
jgi:hypothetical protein